MTKSNEIFKSLRIVSGFASVEVRDSQGDLIDIDAIDHAMYEFMSQSRSLHFEHSLPIGEILKWERREKDGHDAIWIEAYLYDNDATKEIWEKVQNKEIHGFSIRGIAKERDNGKITDLELYEISLVFQPANPQAVLVSAFEKSNSGRYIEILKSRLNNKVVFYESQINKVWQLFMSITDSIFEGTVDDVIAKLEKLKSEILTLKDLSPEIASETDNLVAVINDAIGEAQKIKGEEKPEIQKMLLRQTMRMVSGRFMSWFTYADYLIRNMKRGIK
jgi:hypothetical protein